MQTNRLSPFIKHGLLISVTWLALVARHPAHADETAFLNVSYDVSREIYQNINPALEEAWKKINALSLTSNSLRSSSAGLQVDVIRVNQPPNIDRLAGQAVKNRPGRIPRSRTSYVATVGDVVDEINTVK